MRHEKSIGGYIFDIFNHILMVILVIITLYPMLYVAFASISNPVEIAGYRGILIKPLGFSLEAYKAVFRNPYITTGYLNTLFYVSVGTTINLLMTSMGAYILSRRELYWRKLVTFLIVFTMFFSGGLIPTYLLVKSLGMLNTRWSIIIPNAINVWNLLVMKTSFDNVPTSLIESAKIDGANDFKILFRIVLPVSLPVVAVMILFYAVGHWNAWFAAMIYLRDRNLYPLQLILREILIANDTNMMIGSNIGNVGEREPISVTIQYATIMVATLPILFIYPFLQKYFVKGIMIGAIKE